MSSWLFYILILLGILFILWIFCSGKNYQYIGISEKDPSASDSPKITVIPEPSPQRRIPFPVSYPDVNFPSPEEPLIEPRVISRSEPLIELPITPTPEDRVIIPINSPVRIRNVTHRSIGETICCQVMEEITGKPFGTVRPNFLKNPETGGNVEIDCYNHELRLGVEYNGEQHYRWPNFTRQSYEEFIQQARRDKFKVETCDNHGVYLITVPYDVPHNQIRQYIIDRLPH